ncbi:MAG: glycosyltransferase family 4 protein [Rhizobiaceae bacterium]|nr:glycosyltransferase family 4 protein [Rhizobiaceae bacterium]MCZ8352365.1 glycosyltransferase family 4 protein [Rhizobium sp.]
MRVLMVVPRPLYSKAGGMTRVAENYLENTFLSEAGVDCSFFPTRTTDKLILSLLSQLYRFLLFCPKLVTGGFDMVHIHVAPGGSTWRKMAYAAVARMMRVPVILHLHGSGYDAYFRTQHRFSQSLIRAFYRSSRAVIVLADNWKEFAVGELGVPRQRVHVIDNGVPDSVRKTDRDSVSVRYLFVGSVIHRKGIDILIEAAAALDAEHDWQVLICGAGEIEKYELLARSVGIDDVKLRFLGWKNASEVSELLSTSHVFVLPSRAENQPLSIIEAMASSLPVVATDVGAVASQVDHNATGFVVPADDASALATAMKRLLVDKELRERMGAAGRKKFEDRYEISKNVSRLVDLYRSIV